MLVIHRSHISPVQLVVVYNALNIKIPGGEEPPTSAAQIFSSSYRALYSTITPIDLDAPLRNVPPSSFRSPPPTATANVAIPAIAHRHRPPSPQIPTYPPQHQLNPQINTIISFHASSLRRPPLPNRSSSRSIPNPHCICASSLQHTSERTQGRPPSIPRNTRRTVMGRCAEGWCDPERSGSTRLYACGVCAS